MMNYGLEIYINDEYVCRAGFENKYHVLTSIINSVRRESDNSEELFFQVGGRDSETEQHVDWIKKELKSGDRISIQVITDKFDKPLHIREGSSGELMLKRKIEHYYKLKDELKDYLTD